MPFPFPPQTTFGERLGTYSALVTAGVPWIWGMAADSRRRTPGDTKSDGARPRVWDRWWPRPTPTRPADAAAFAAAIRHQLRSAHHPARAVTCPFCSATPPRACTTISKRYRLTETSVHTARINTWARTVACCPTCQVVPTVPCHLAGEPLYDDAVHNQRINEALRAAR